jgi:hypothetical protein
MIKAALAIAIGISAMSATSYALNAYNVNATSCAADAGSIRNNLYIGTGGTVKFASGETGNIVLYCPVFTLGFTPRLLGFAFYDDTSVPGNHVTVQLMKMAADGSELTSIVTVDSDKASVTANGKASHTAHEFTDQYDPINCAYYIRIDIARNSPTANEIIYSVTLQN